MTAIKGMEAAGGAEIKTSKVKFCNPSVCVGGAQPTSCVCPTTPKK